MTAADLTIAVSSQEGIDERTKERRARKSAREDKGVESSYDVPVTTDPFYTLLTYESSSSSGLAARNLFVFAIKNALG